MARRNESFDITRIDTETGVVQGTTVDGKVREFSLVVDRDLATNKLSLGVVPHYTDPQSDTPAFSESETWTEDERRGQSE